MVTASEGCVNVMLFVGVGSTGIIPILFALVTCLCVSRVKRICVSAVSGDDVWVVFVGAYITFSAFVPTIFSNLYKASPWRLWEV